MFLPSLFSKPLYKNGELSIDILLVAEMCAIPPIPGILLDEIEFLIQENRSFPLARAFYIDFDECLVC
jgi:hypothetical protein